MFRRKFCLFFLKQLFLINKKYRVFIWNLIKISKGYYFFVVVGFLRFVNKQVIKFQLFDFIIILIYMIVYLRNMYS